MENGIQSTAREEFNRHREQAWQDRQSSSDAFDKNLLTFSSGALGLSLAFIKDVVPLDNATHLVALYASWICFASCIVVTVASYPMSVAAINKHLIHLEEYYVKGNEKFLNPRNIWSKFVTLCTIIGGLFFLGGVITTVIFIANNILLKEINK